MSTPLYPRTEELSLALEIKRELMQRMAQAGNQASYNDELRKLMEELKDTVFAVRSLNNQ